MSDLTKDQLIAKHKREAVDFVQNFYGTSWRWRNQAYHANWDIYEQNYRNIYDPTISAKKENWQAQMFIPDTVTNVEVIVCSLTKILLGRKYPIGVDPREMGDELQAQLNSDLLNHQLDVSDFGAVFHAALREACIFGTGFLKIFWEKKYDKRRIKVPKTAGFKDAYAGFKTGKMIIPGYTKMGESEEVKDVLSKDQITIKKVHIRNMFLEPNSLTLNRVLERDKVTYGELVDLSKQKNSMGDYLIDPQSVLEMKDFKETDIFEIDERPVKALQQIQDPMLPRALFDKRHTVWEMWAPIPRKWIQLDLDDDAKNADEVIPGKILVGSAKWFLASEENPMQSMEPPYVKVGYIPSGQTYDIGVAQLIKGLQEEHNEIRNLRVDNVNLILNKIFIAKEKNLVDGEDGLVSKPGAVILVKGSEVTRVQDAVAELPVSDVALSGFRETGELERQIQETTAANRVTLGTAGMQRDQNHTLGGMELLRQAAEDRFTVYAFMIGKSMEKIAQKYMELIYQNMSDDMIKRILGIMPIAQLNLQTGQDDLIPRYQLYKKTSPQELMMNYDMVPFDVFSESNKAQKATQVAAFLQLAASLLPQLDPKPGLKRIAYYNGLEEEEITEILGSEKGPVPTPMMMGQGVPSSPNTSGAEGLQSPKPVSAGPLGGTPSPGGPMAAAAPMNMAPGGNNGAQR